MRRADPRSSESGQRISVCKRHAVDVAAVGLLFVMMCGGRASAEQSYDVEEILDGMLAAEAQFQNLYMEWTLTVRGSPDQIIEGAYAHKDIGNGDKKMYLAVKSTAPIPGMRGSDSISSYDGTKTVWLRSREGGKAPRAFISKGIAGQSGVTRTHFQNLAFEPLVPRMRQTLPGQGKR